MIWVGNAHPPEVLLGRQLRILIYAMPGYAFTGLVLLFIIYSLAMPYLIPTALFPIELAGKTPVKDLAMNPEQGYA